MGLAKKTDGRYVVGKGIADANDYKGSAAWRDMVIQLTESGATEKSEEYLNFLKDYALNANSLGEPIMPPSVDVWISNHGTTTAVEADDVAIDGANYTICGIKWDGSAWDYTNAGQGSGGGSSSLPSYSSSDIGKVLTVGEASPVETEVVVVPEQTLTFAEYVTSGGEITVYLAPLPLDGVTNGAMYTATIDGVEMSSTAALDQITFGQGQFKIRQEIGVSTIPNGWYLNGRSVHAGDSITFSLKTVQSVTPSTTTVIVPEQTVTVSDGSPVPLTDAVVSGFVTGNAGVMVVNGESYNVTATDDDGVIIFGNADPQMIGLFNGNVLFGARDTGTYTVSLTASVPSVEPKWEAAGGGSGALIIKASGEAMYSVDDGYAVQADVDETTLNNCFLPDTAKPVYALFPAFSSIGGVAAYSYDNANGNYMMPLSKPQTSVKIGEYETYSVFKLSGHVYLGYKENSV